MKNHNPIPSGLAARTLRITLPLALLFAGGQFKLHAQLVNDGDFVTINNSTNLTGDLIVGTNGGNTRLGINSPGTVTNVNGRIGLNAASSGNQVRVANAGAVWINTGSLYVGDQGANNLLLVTNGGNVFLTDIRIGNTNSAAGNQAVITGTNSLLSSSGAGSVGYDAPGNSLVIAGGASVANNNGYIGNNSASASNNWVTVTGPGSAWNISFSLNVGYYGSGNQLTVSNGASVANNFFGIIGVNSGSDNNRVLVTGPGSAWNINSTLYVGHSGSGNQLTVRNGAGVVNASGYLGFNLGSDNNSALITGSNSAWNINTFNLGFNGSGNQLTVSDGAVVANTSCNMGYNPGSDNNSALITGSNSAWINSFSLYLGNSGSGNQLTVSNGASVVNTAGYLGYSSGSDNNSALITGSGSVWTNSDDLFIGRSGAGNTLRLLAGGMAAAADSAYIGSEAGSSNNLLRVNGGTLTVATNLDVRRGTLRLDIGTVSAAALIATNATADGGGFLLFNGGTLITGGGTVSNDQPFVVGAGGTTAARLDVRSNTPLVVNHDFTLGANTATGNHLILTNGGTLSVTGTSYVGTDEAASNNLVTITGPDSLWTNSSEFYFGYLSGGNQLVVSDGGRLVDGFAYIGLAASSSNNTAVVTGTGSIWTNTGDLRVGAYGSGNQLVVNNGGTVVSGAIGYIGFDSGSSNNMAVVTGAGSLWTNGTPLATLNVGYSGSGNQLVVSNGGTVETAKVYVGFDASSTNNRVTVSGGSLIVTNSGGTGELGIRRGTNVLNAGLLVTDNLLLNNSAGFFEFNGGTLIPHVATVDNGQPFVVGNGSSPATYQLNGNGSHTFNDGLVIAADATLTGNGTVDGPLTVESGGNLSPSTPAGLLVLNNSPVLQGLVHLVINKKGLNRTNNQIQVAAPLTYGGDLLVSKNGFDDLAIGDSFQLFGATSYGGAFTSMSLPWPGPDLMWSNQLLLNGSIAVVPFSAPTLGGFTQTGTNLTFEIAGGSPGTLYELVTSTNVVTPLVDWVSEGVGQFDCLGNAMITNGINEAEPERYFRVRVFNGSLP